MDALYKQPTLSVDTRMLSESGISSEQTGQSSSSKETAANVLGSPGKTLSDPPGSCVATAGSSEALDFKRSGKAGDLRIILPLSRMQSPETPKSEEEAPLPAPRPHYPEKEPPAKNSPVHAAAAATFTPQEQEGVVKVAHSRRFGSLQANSLVLGSPVEEGAYSSPEEGNK